MPLHRTTSLVPARQHNRLMALLRYPLIKLKMSHLHNPNALLSNNRDCLVLSATIYLRLRLLLRLTRNKPQTRLTVLVAAPEAPL